MSKKSAYEAPESRTVIVKPARIICLSGDAGNENVGTRGTGYSDINFE